jgi:hypothetical protein
VRRGAAAGFGLRALPLGPITSVESCEPVKSFERFGPGFEVVEFLGQVHRCAQVRSARLAVAENQQRLTASIRIETRAARRQFARLCLDYTKPSARSSATFRARLSARVVDSGS